MRAFSPITDTDYSKFQSRSCSAVRYCGSTFSYTAISVLLNYSTSSSAVSSSSRAHFTVCFSVSPPHLVGFANGIAQSIVSLARFAGPILGGTVRTFVLSYPRVFCLMMMGVCSCQLWSTSVQDNPSGYPLGFIVCSLACGLAILHSFFIR